MNAKKLFSGLGTAIVTLFKKDGKIDWKAMRELIKQQIKAGVNYLVVCGTTGESPTLSHEEHIRLIQFVVKEVRGRVPVLAGTGSNNTVEAMRLTRAAKAAGADGVLVVSPYYNKPTQRGIKEYYRAIAKIGLPIILYDIPGRCGGQGVSAQTILELAREGVICGLKWASGNLDQLQDVLAGRLDDFVVLSGDDNLTFAAMALGAHGVISVLSNLIPKEIADFVTEMKAGFWQEARAFHYAYLRLMRAMFIETNPIPVKTSLYLMSPEFVSYTFRSPMCQMSEENLVKLKVILEEYGLI